MDVLTKSVPGVQMRQTMLKANYLEDNTVEGIGPKVLARLQLHSGVRLLRA